MSSVQSIAQFATQINIYLANVSGNVPWSSEEGNSPRQVVCLQSAIDRWRFPSLVFNLRRSERSNGGVGHKDPRPNLTFMWRRENSKLRFLKGPRPTRITASRSARPMKSDWQGPIYVSSYTYLLVKVVRLCLFHSTWPFFLSVAPAIPF